METPTVFGKRLKQVRQELNLTQEDLAKKLNTTKQNISKYETNVREPEYNTLIQIAKALNTSVDYLLGLTDIRTPYPPPNDKQ